MTVTHVARMVVVNSRSQHDYAIVGDVYDDISLGLAGDNGRWLSFSGEFRHVDDWATNNGLTVTHKDFLCEMEIRDV